MTRHKGSFQRFPVGQPVRLCADEARTGKVVTSDARRLTAEVAWDAGGSSTELWCNLWKPNEPTRAAMPFPNVR